MHFSTVFLAALSFGAQTFAVPTAGFALSRRDATQATVSGLSDSFNKMATTVHTDVIALNASAAANHGKPSMMTVFKTFSDTSGSFTTLAKTVTPLLTQASSSSFSFADLGAEGIEELVSILKVYSSLLSEVYGVVDAVVNAFFPGLTDLFRPFIQIWINVVDSFSDPLFSFYATLVSELTDSPALATAINDYVEEIKEIRDNFLLAF